MNIKYALELGQIKNKAIRRRTWDEEYCYHGMDNQLIYVDARGYERKESTMAQLLADDWELSEQPYHGKLSK